MKSERTYPVYKVNKHAEGLLVGGHPWVYENDILHAPDTEPENGTLADVVSPKGAYLGTGFVSLHSKIRVRLISRNANDTFDAAFWRRRVEYAWAYRKTVLEPADLSACRVIFVTAYSLFQYAHEAVHLGACDYLLKPVDPDELEASIRRAMRQIEAERKLEELARTTELSPEPETPEVPENPEEDAPEAESPEGENSQTAMVMTQVRRYLEDNYMFDLSLDSVGEILHISPAYLSAQFKKYQKMNFLDCLTELRINAAKELLADPFRSSAEVASMVGYEDASYFARAFKKRTGMTPTQYRRQAGKKSAEAHL